MNSIENHFDNALDFIQKNQSLVDCHLVDFITKDLWTECLSSSLRQQLEGIKFIDQENRQEIQQDINKLSLACSELQDFVSQADLLSLKNSNCITTLEDIIARATESKGTADVKKSSSKFMSDKKQHEIEVLAKLIGHLAKENETSLVIDAGAGKGYLSTSIAEQFGIPVLAVDSSNSNQKSAIRRQEIMKKKTHRETTLVRYAVKHIDEKTDYKQLVDRHFSDCESNKNFLLTGLHTCGQLAHSMMNNFLSADCLETLCLVPCCYHLTEESLTGRCKFGKNARMLAQQSVERSQSRIEQEPHPPSLFYRALLQVVLQSLGFADTRIGRGAPTQDFPSYAFWALRKIGADSEKVPSSESLAELYQSHSDSRWKFNVFQSMRVLLGSVVEAAIVLDRVLYLEGSDRCRKVVLLQLFDPLISPRCFAIVASK